MPAAGASRTTVGEPARAVDVELVAADVDQPPGMRKLAALEGGGDALIGGAGEHEEDDDRAAGDERAARDAARQRH